MLEREIVNSNIRTEREKKRERVRERDKREI